MVAGRLVARIKNYVIKSYNYQVELVKTFKKDWKEMEDASAPMPNPPEWEPKLMTIAK